MVDTSKYILVFITNICYLPKHFSRAGAPLNDPSTLELAKRLQDSDYVDFYGIYTHAGHSYSAKSAIDGLEYLKTECDMARRFRDYFTTNGVAVKTVSIGATPTIHAVVKFAQEDKENIKQVLDGITELHAGAFSFLDRQQAATGLCTLKDIAISVVSRVASNYSDRDSLLIDGGGLAFSKDTAPQGGFGYVLDPAIKPDINQEPIVLATLTKVAQEHGVVSDLNSSILSRSDLGIGSLVRVLPNHCCLTAASHMYYLIVEDGSDVVLDVWVPVKGW
jgi:D-serine deaminase-like pyridoxal phosphate-dependent protein